MTFLINGFESLLNLTCYQHESYTFKPSLRLMLAKLYNFLSRNFYKDSDFWSTQTTKLSATFLHLLEEENEKRMKLNI